jgi:hypothetical protein
MRESLGQEPLWNAGRRARSVERAPHLQVRWLVEIAPFGVLLPFLSFVPCVGAAPDRDASGPPLPDTSDEGWVSGEVLGDGLLNTRGANKKAQRENGIALLFPLPAARGEVGLRAISAFTRVFDALWRAIRVRGPIRDSERVGNAPSSLPSPRKRGEGAVRAGRTIFLAPLPLQREARSRYHRRRHRRGRLRPCRTDI